MKDSNQTVPQLASPGSGRFSAMINDKPFLTTSLTGLSCLRPELVGARTCRIWKINVVGQVARHRTMLGLFIDQTLQPGTYDLVCDDRVSAVYHLTPPQLSQVYHSQNFQSGSVTLLECNAETGRLRGTFEFGMSAINFKVSAGEFDLVCQRDDGTSVLST